MTIKTLILAGGTGGHIFPGIEIAQVLQKHNYKVSWLGSRNGLEKTIVPKYNIPIDYIQVSGLRGKGMLSWLCAPFNLIRALYQSIKVILKVQPEIVIAMGGFVSGPASIAAKLLRKKLIVHEQNAIAGTTNKILHNFANLTLESFPNSFYSKHRNKSTVLLGNPVRCALQNLSTPTERYATTAQGPLRILVFGGSRGALQINQCIPKFISIMQEKYPNKIECIHQSGSTKLNETQEIYNQLNIQPYKLVPFIDDMAQAYNWAHLVICRSGATTIFELMAIGIASILIPYPFATNNHQLKNANYLVQQQASKLIESKHLTPTMLASMVTKFLNNPSDLRKMALAAKNLYPKNLKENLVKHINDVAVI